MKHDQNTLLIILAIFSIAIFLFLAGCAQDIDLEEEYPLEKIGTEEDTVTPVEVKDTTHAEPSVEPIKEVETVNQEPAEPFKEKPIELEEVEVKEYNGVKLGSSEDFRDNSIKGPQYIDRSSYQLEIGGLVEDPQKLTYEQVLDQDMYSKIVTLNCVEGWSVKILWEGILLKDLLDEAGVYPKANTVILYAEDGYSTSLPLDYITDNNIMLAYKMNNKTLEPERGFPFQLVAEQKWGYKWIKWITKIELSDDPEYEGFWEERGWDNDADLDKAPR